MLPSVKSSLHLCRCRDTTLSTVRCARPQPISQPTRDYLEKYVHHVWHQQLFVGLSKHTLNLVQTNSMSLSGYVAVCPTAKDTFITKKIRLKYTPAASFQLAVSRVKRAL